MQAAPLVLSKSVCHQADEQSLNPARRAEGSLDEETMEKNDDTKEIISYS